MMPSVPRDRLVTRWGALKSERASWMAHWQEISDYLLPRSGRFFASDRNRGERRHNSIYDSTGTRALRILAAGMMSGMTSPARQWFRLTTADTDLMEYQPVKLWMDSVTQIMLAVFNKSNTYRCLHTLYEELGAFGTGASIVVPDFYNVIHHHSLTIGEYCLATDYRGNVNTLYREFQKSVHELVAEFGLDKVSSQVRAMYDRGNLDAWVTVIHAIEPRADRDPSRSDAKNMPWRSVYFEVGAGTDQYLRESGYRRFPALCPRWSVSGGDLYGNSPGMEALGDIKQLQHAQLRKAQGIDYQTNPPLQVPTSLKNRNMEMFPGGITFVDVTGSGSAIKTAFDVSLNLSHLLSDIQDVRERIRGAFYADIFLMMENLDGTRMTATEVAERHEEKLLMLGPVLERLQNELLEPLIDITFDAILDANLAFPAPDELRGHELNVEMVSMIAQAQRSIGTNTIDRFTGSLGAVAQIKPEVLDKFDPDAWVDSYASSLGLDPKIIVPGDQVKAVREQRAQAQQAQQQSAMLQQMSGAARNLAAARTDQPSALTSIAGALQQGQQM